MDLTLYVERLRRELSIAADAGGDDARVIAERLTAPLESSIRLLLLDALSCAADEITSDLAPGSVEVRLRSGEPEFVVAPPLADASAPSVTDRPLPPPPPEAEDGATARINLRLPEHLKSGVDEAATRERLSTNTWLVRLVAAAVAGSDRPAPLPPRGGRIGQAYTGWVR